MAVNGLGGWSWLDPGLAFCLIRIVEFTYILGNCCCWNWLRISDRVDVFKGAGVGAIKPLSQHEIDSRLRGLLKKEQVNCATRLEKMRFQPRAKSKINIPLCRMISLPTVRPFLKNDVLNLASHFVSYGYLEGNGVFYVSLEDNEERTKAVTDEIIATWSESWISVNAEFEHLL
jgi:hypothetical protein